MAVHAPPPWFRRDWFWGLMLIPFVLLAYTPMWHAGFIWGDDVMLKANRCIVGPLGLKEIWTTSAADICPFVLSTFWVEHALWGLEPLPYHLVNIVMHGACAVLLWRVLRSLRVEGAWLGAALWALHPVEVESVAWIIEMKNTESALFFLLSILFFVKWLNFGRVASPMRPLPAGGSDHLRSSSYGASANRARSRHSGATAEIRPYRARASAYILSLLFAALAMASKSSTVILPVVLCLCAWWIEGRWNWRNLARVLPVFLMSVAASAVSIWTQGLQLARATDPQWVRTWPLRLATAGDAVWFYLGKLLWPDPLITIYLRWQIDAGQWVSYLPLLAVILLFTILWVTRRSGIAGSRACFFAFAYFVTALLPVLGLIDTFVFRFSLVFDHFQYLASIGPLALAGAALAWSREKGIGVSDFAKDFGELSRAASSDRSEYQRVGVAAGISKDKILTRMEPALSGWRARNKNLLCDLRGLLCKFFLVPSTEIANPFRVLASKNLWFRPAFCAGLLVVVGMITWQRSLAYQSEEILWRDTLAKNPNSWFANNTLGDALLQKGQLGEAIAQFRKALDIYPNYDAGHYNLGVALFREGQFDESIAQFQKALQINPNYAEAHSNLGLALLQKGQLDDAIEQYQVALKINPSFALAHANLGVAFIRKGQIDDAIAQFQEALRLNPNLRPVRDALEKTKALESKK